MIGPYYLFNQNYRVRDTWVPGLPGQPAQSVLVSYRPVKDSFSENIVNRSPVTAPKVILWLHACVCCTYTVLYGHMPIKHLSRHTLRNACTC